MTDPSGRPTSAAFDAIHEQRRNQRRRELRRMRAFATGLLVAMLALYVATSLADDRWPWLAFVRAFAEAAMVGACADWFAVVALFRHPFGIPIPHTAIVPRNKERIGESLGSFICNNFLDPAVVSAKVSGLDIAGKAARWLATPANAAFVARRSAGLMPPMLEALEEEGVRAFVRGAARRGLDAVEAAPLAGRVLSVLVARGHHQHLFDHAIAMAEEFLFLHEEAIRGSVSARSYKWLPKWVDQRLSDRVIGGLLETLHELRAPEHPWRGAFQGAVEDFAARLGSDPELRARGEVLKAEVLDNPLAEQYLDSLWGEIKLRLKADLAADNGIVKAGVERALMALGRRLEEDPRMQDILNRWVMRAIDRYIVPHRDEIGGFIAGVVARWDTRTLVDKLELQVGKDLQYIRINGTLVGGLVGVVIYAVSHLL
ncbi:MAG: DUF445 domain-containing protein [Magnetospirillum sp.]|nr:DUF445 domain-containing protein [Magnetospirillum sp.]